MNSAAWAVMWISLSAAIIFAARYSYLQAKVSKRPELTGTKEYRGLADEYRRLSDMAITANEHVDLRLTDLSVRVDELRDQLDHMQRILKEVE